MRHSLIPGALAILTIGLATPATSETRDREARTEQVVVEMERLFSNLLGDQDLETEFIDQGNGIYSLAVSLDQLGREWRNFPQASAAKDVTNLHHGHMVTEPTSATTLIHSANPNLSSEYNFWWAAVNEGSSDRELKTTLSHKGAGPDLKETFQFVYPAETLILSWVGGVGHEGGLYKSFVKISGAGNAKTKGGCYAFDG